MNRAQVFSPLDRLFSKTSTFILSDDGTNQTLTGNLGILNITAGSDIVNLPRYIWAHNAAAGNTNIFGLNGGTNSGWSNQVNAPISAQFSWNTAGDTYSTTHRGLLMNATNALGPTYTNNTLNILSFQNNFVSFNNPAATALTWTQMCGLFCTINAPGQGSTTTATVTDMFAADLIVQTSGVGTPGTWTNARGARITVPNLGNTIRRGVHVRAASTTNRGTESANTEGFFCDALPWGTAQRTSYYASGATTSTPTDVYGFYLGTAHTVGTNRYGFRATGATTGTPTNCIGFYADAQGVGTNKWSFYGNDNSFFTGITLADATDITINATTGSKIGQSGSKIGHYGATPVAQPTTGIAAATFVANTSGIANDSATWDGYTIGQVVKALRNEGLLA